MEKLYLQGLARELKPVVEELGRVCQALGVTYNIVEDAPLLQRFNLSSVDPDLISHLQAFGRRNGVLVENIGLSLNMEPGVPDDSRYNLGCIDPDIEDKIMQTVIGYMGERHADQIRTHLFSMDAPVRKLDTNPLYDAHKDHQRYTELGDQKSSYVDVVANFPPLVVDSLAQGTPVNHAGVLVDGFRRLYASYYRQEPQVKAIDIKDLVDDCQQHLGFNEDQYKSPTRKMVRKQSAFPSSFGPSKSFGGVGDQEEDKYSMGFSESLDAVLKDPAPQSTPTVTETPTTFENKLGRMLGAISIVEPDILFTVKPDGKIE